jgi:hypothetical protein
MHQNSCHWLALILAMLSDSGYLIVLRRYNRLENSECAPWFRFRHEGFFFERVWLSQLYPHFIFPAIILRFSLYFRWSFIIFDIYWSNSRSSRNIRIWDKSKDRSWGWLQRGERGLWFFHFYICGTSFWCILLLLLLLFKLFRILFIL